MLPFYEPGLVKVMLVLISSTHQGGEQSNISATREILRKQSGSNWSHESLGRFLVRSFLTAIFPFVNLVIL